MMLSISVTAFAQDTSSDCDKEYYDRYGRWMENHLVTWWGVPPVLMRSSGKYADLICEKLSEINYEDTHFFITFLMIHMTISLLNPSISKFPTFCAKKMLK